MSIRIPGGGGSSGGSGDLSADGTGWPTTAAVTFGEDLTIATTKNILAAADGTSDIGTGSKRFNLGYFDRLNLDNGANNAVVLTVQATDAGANAGTIGISSFLTANSLGAAIRGQATLGLAARFETVGASANPVVYIEGDTSHTGYLLALGTEAVTHTAISVDGDTYLRVPPAAAAGASVAGLPLNVTAGVAVASTDTAGAAAGGAVGITAGNAARLTSGDAAGGAVTITGGNGIGDGDGGDIVLVGGALSGTGGTGQVIIPAGTAARPGLGFDPAVDTGSNSGLSCTSNNIVAINCNGTEILSVQTGSTTFSGSEILGGSSGPTQRGFRRPIFIDTDGRTISASGHDNRLWSNAGATGTAAFILPTAAAGNNFGFVDNDASDLISVAPASGDTIFWGPTGQVITSTGTATSAARYDSCELVAIDGDTWITTSVYGTWTIVTS